MDHYQNYCVECDWSASKKDHSTSELASLAIEHAVSTGHDIDSRRVSDGSDSNFRPEITGEGVHVEATAQSDTPNTGE